MSAENTQMTLDTVMTEDTNTTTTSKRIGRRQYRRYDGKAGKNRDFMGETPELDIVLCLKSERLNKSVPFKKFQERLSNYVLKNIPRAEDVVMLINELQDPLQDFSDKNFPGCPSEEEQKSPIQMKMWEMRVKRFLGKEKTL